MKYSEQDIRNSVKAADFIKGKEYFRYGYVTECTPKTDNDTLLIFSSKSRGSYASFYTQTVQLYKTSKPLIRNASATGTTNRIFKSSRCSDIELIK